MNFAYYRKSTFSQEKTVENVKAQIKKQGLTFLGATDLPAGKGTVLHVCNPTWIGNLIASDTNLIGLLPCSVAVISSNNEVMVGVGSPAVLGGVSQNPAVIQLASQVESKLKELIHASAGVGPLKAKSVKLYSTTSCPYCKMEASWLDSKKVTYEEVKVDVNPQAGEEMVRKTGQMGVPVTEIAYENGEEEFIIGFNQNQLEAILGGIQ